MLFWTDGAIPDAKPDGYKTKLGSPVIHERLNIHLFTMQNTSYANAWAPSVRASFGELLQQMQDTAPGSIAGRILFIVIICSKPACSP
jgi:hypothetical protein